MKNFKTILCVLLGVILVSATLVAAQQKAPDTSRLMQKKPVFMPTIKVELKGHAYWYKGSCPAHVKFTGKVTSTGPAKLKYHFVRSEGASARLIQLTFRARGTKTLPYLWKFGKDGRGWVQLVVVHGNKKIESPRVEFNVDCDERKKTPLQIKKFDPKLVKVPMKVQLPKFKLEKIKGIFHKLIAVDLVTKEVKPWRTTIHWTWSQRIRIKLENHGIKTSPPCLLHVTLISSRPSPKTGKKVFLHKYTVRPIPSGKRLYGNVGWKGFWPGNWNVVVKVDGSDIIDEGNKEGNNLGATKFEVK